MPSRYDRGRRGIIGALVAACYLYPFPYFEELNNPNERVRVYMTMAIVDDGTFAIDGPCQRFGWVNDRAAHEGRLYSGKAPGTSIVGVPIYAALQWLCPEEPSLLTTVRLLRLFSITLPSLVFLFFFRRFLDRTDFSPWLRDTMLVGYALGSMAYSYGLMFTGHQLSAICLTGSLIAFYDAGAKLENDQTGAGSRAALGGLLLGAAPAMEYPTALATMIVAVYAILLLRHRPSMLGVAFFASLLPIGLLLTFHNLAFGSPFAFPYDFIENPAFQRLLSEGWHGATYPRLDRLVTIIASPSFGLLFFTPLLILAPIGWIAGARQASDLPPFKRHLMWALPATSLVLILYLSSSALWRAGWSVGPRYIASAVPLLAIAALHGAGELEKHWPKVASIVTATLVMISVVHSGTSGALYPHQPELFDNPVYDLNIRLITLGFAPHTAFESLGIVGYSSLLILGLIAALALVLVSLGPLKPRLQMASHGLIVVGATVLSCVALSGLGESTADEERMWSLVMRTWEPRGHSAPEGRLSDFEALEVPNSHQVRAAAADAALLGRAEQLRELEEQAARLELQERREELGEQLLPELGLNPGWAPVLDDHK